MSYRHMAIVWEMAIPSATQKLILMGLASYANEEGQCWPCQDSLAARVGCSVRTVGSHIAAMEEAGWLARESRSSHDGRRSDLYILTLPEQQTAESATCKICNLQNLQVAKSAGSTKGEEHTNRRTPLTPRSKPDPMKAEIPPELDGPEFRAAWDAWAKERRARGKKLTAQAARLQLAKLEKEAKDSATAAEWIYFAIEKGWQGIYRPKDSTNDQKNGRPGIMWTGFDQIDYSAGQIRGNDGRTYV